MYCLVAFVLPPSTLVEIGSLILYADSVKMTGLRFSNLFDVGVGGGGES